MSSGVSEPCHTYRVPDEASKTTKEVLDRRAETLWKQRDRTQHLQPALETARISSASRSRRRVCSTRFGDVEEYDAHFYFDFTLHESLTHRAMQKWYRAPTRSCASASLCITVQRMRSNFTSIWIMLHEVKSGVNYDAGRRLGKLLWADCDGFQNEWENPCGVAGQWETSLHHILRLQITIFIIFSHFHLAGIWSRQTSSGISFRTINIASVSPRKQCRLVRILWVPGRVEHRHGR